MPDVARRADLGAQRRQRRRALGRGAVVRRAAAARATSRTSRSPPTATSTTSGFPVQWVVRPHDDAHHDYRGYAGQVAGGVLRAGDEVVVLPQGARTRIGAHRHARRPGRGGVPADVGHRAARGRPRRLARRHARARADAPPQVARELDADVCWMADAPAAPGRALPAQAHDAHDARASVDADRSTASTSRACAPRPTRARSSSTTSAGSRCAPRGRWRSTPTPTTAPPALHPHRRGDATTPSPPGMVCETLADADARSPNVVWERGAATRERPLGGARPVAAPRSG